MPDDKPQPVPGKDLLAQREEAGISQLELAKRMGISRDTIRRWEAKPQVASLPAGRYQRALTAILNEALARPA